MRALKALVVIMGVMIVAGVGVIIVTIIHRMNGARLQGSQSPAAVAVAAPGRPGHAQLAIPSGSRIEGMTALGERLALRLVDGAGRQSLMLIDPATGSLVETIDLVAATP